MYGKALECRKRIIETLEIQVETRRAHQQILTGIANRPFDATGSIQPKSYIDQRQFADIELKVSLTRDKTHESKRVELEKLIARQARAVEAFKISEYY